MSSTNGHGPRRAVLYARVSTDEQARSGYSLAQQMEALREYAAREGYEVLEEVTDPGQSGASLERPGMDRIRETVSSGGVSAVLAHDRDRISREPAYLYILKTEFEAKGCTLRALNDRGDDSPEGQLTDGIIDQLAKFEREKFKERSRRGRLRKAREGRISVTYPKYGFRFKDDNRTELVVYEPEMLIVKKLFELAAEGYGLAAICSRLSQEGIRTPRGHERWDQRAVSRSIFCDMYKPHTYSEVKELVAPEVAASLDPAKEYGIHFANRTKVTYSPISEPDDNGGKQYRKSKTIAVRPREDWIAVPVPAYLSRELVEQARGELKAHKPTERKHLTRPWELRGLIRCSCGRLMTTHTANPRKNKLYHYYTCRDRDRGAPGVGCREKSLNAIKTETRVWELISGILSNPETLKNGMERLIEQEKSRIGGGNDQERKA